MSSLSLLVPTLGRPSLARALNSVKDQLASGDEVIVVGDTHDGELPEVEALVRDYGKQFRYLAHDAGHHCWGHCTLMYGINRANGDYIHCSDDDDCWSPDALDAMRGAIAELNEPHPLLFRFRSWYGPVFWSQRGLIAEGQIGGHCLVTPNIPDRIGVFGCRYEGDYDYILSTLQKWPRGILDAQWVDRIVAIARPE